MNTRKTLLLDVDEVVCFPGFLPLINEFLGTNYVIDDFTTYYIDEEVIPKYQIKDFNKFISTKNLYDNNYVQELPGAIKTIKELNNYYTIYILSSCINPFDLENSGKLYLDKYNYLMKTIPFIRPDRYIFATVKNIFNADIQIDDRLKNLKSNINTKILFPSYHNKNVTIDELENNNVIRAGYDWKIGWYNIENILLNSNAIEYNPHKIYSINNKRIK